MADGPVVAVVPARGGSKGLTRKNLRLLAGKPLLAHSVQAAVKAQRVERVIVTTDDEEIARVSRQWGAETPFLRPDAFRTPSGRIAELTSDWATTEDTLAHACHWLRENEGTEVGILVYLQTTDVFRRTGWIDEVVRRLQEDPTLETAFVAYKTHKNFWKNAEGGGYEPLGEYPGHSSRQRKRPVYREDTGLACATRARLLLEEPPRRVGSRVDILWNEDPATAVDIHDEFDLWLAEEVLTEWKGSDVYDIAR
ncbi:MAG: cytidylyltransferase domain-containing protein [Nitrospinota bacterium]